jgi:VWFA-related protein
MPDSPSSPDQEEEPQPIFQAEVEVVTIPVTVTDSSGEFVTDLDRKDFRVFDNGRDQKIEQFELSLEPLSMVIAVETSSRVESQLPEIRRAGILVTQLVLGENGEGAVLTFDREIELVQDFTSDPEKIEAALRDLKPGGTDVRLSDALTRALNLLQRREKDRRKVVVVISEARDIGSSNTPGFVLRGAQQLGISIYTISMSTASGMFSRAGEGATSPFPPGVMARPMPSNQPPTPDAQARLGAANVDLLPLIAELVSYTKSWLGGNPLDLYAAGTGADDFSGGKSAELEQALSTIGRELRSQYLLTYRPNNLGKAEFHAVRVAVPNPNLQVRTRPGYMFVPRTNRGSPAAPKNGSRPKSVPPQ